MKFVIFGLTITSSWGNGHATIWRGLCKALVHRGHEIVFMERDVPYYAAHRDVSYLPDIKIYLYQNWPDALAIAETELKNADVGIVTSYCPDGSEASQFINRRSSLLRVFYDMDTPITLKSLADGQSVFYVEPRGLTDFDYVFSYTGGKALEELKYKLGAQRTAPLYGCADPEVHMPTKPVNRYLSDLSYLGTYSEDRQAALEQLFLQTASRLPDKKFMIGGSLYPQEFPWTTNIWFRRHVPPPEHSSFYCSSTFTLNVTRQAMADMGYCPSGRFFEAAACGVPVITDLWEGINLFFKPAEEIVIARETNDVVNALQMPEDRRLSIAKSAMERVLAEHTASRRAEEFERVLLSS